MGIPAKQIGWSQESYLLHAISRQLELLAGVLAVSGGGGLGNFVTTDTVQIITAKKTFTVVSGPSAVFSADTDNGLHASSSTGSGIYTTSVDGPGVEAFSVNDPGAFAYSTNSYGVYANSANSVSIVADCLNALNTSDIANFNFNSVIKAKIDYQGGFSANTTKTEGFTVAALPSPPLSGIGTRAYVTNALTPSFGSAVVGGGAVTIPVFYNGTTWIVG
jgi:hypothetical protein